MSRLDVSGVVLELAINHEYVCFRFGSILRCYHRNTLNGPLKWAYKSIMMSRRLFELSYNWL